MEKEQPTVEPWPHVKIREYLENGYELSGPGEYMYPIDATEQIIAGLLQQVEEAKKALHFYAWVDRIKAEEDIECPVTQVAAQALEKLK